MNRSKNCAGIKGCVKMHGNRTPPGLSSYGSCHIFAKIGGLCGGVTDTFQTSQYLSLQETALSLVVLVKRPCSVVRACALVLLLIGFI